MFSKEDFELELESRLNEFYHLKIVPLEKEIIRLGGKLKPENDEIDLEIGRFLPKNPFKEKIKNIHYWEDKNSDYYRFFKSLFEECIEKEWIRINPHLYSYEDTFIYWMWVFGCIDNSKTDLNITLNLNSEKIVTPIGWYGQNNLCVYLLDKLEKEGYITSSRPNVLTRQHFLTNSTISTIANTKSKNKSKSPSKSSVIDNLIFELTARLD